MRMMQPRTIEAQRRSTKHALGSRYCYIVRLRFLIFSKRSNLWVALPSFTRYTAREGLPPSRFQLDWWLLTGSHTFSWADSTWCTPSYQSKNSLTLIQSLCLMAVQLMIRRSVMIVPFRHFHREICCVLPCKTNISFRIPLNNLHLTIHWLLRFSDKRIDALNSSPADELYQLITQPTWVWSRTPKHSSNKIKQHISSANCSLRTLSIACPGTLGKWDSRNANRSDG